MFLWSLPRASLIAQLLKNPPAMQETLVWSLGWEDPLEEGMAYPLQYSCLEDSRTEESGGLQFTRSQRVGHDWVTILISSEPMYSKYSYWPTLRLVLFLFLTNVNNSFLYPYNLEILFQCGLHFKVNDVLKNYSGIKLEL